MTKKEADEFNKFMGRFDEYYKNDAEWKAEFKSYVINELTNVRQMLSDEQARDDKRLNQIEEDISGSEGIKARISKLERINRNALRVVSAIGTAIGGTLMYFKEIIINAWYNITH